MHFILLLMVMYFILAVFSLLSIAALSFGAAYALRQGFKFLLREFWQRWSVRRSVDVAIAGFFCLIGASLVFTPTVNKMTNEFAHSMDARGVKVLLSYKTQATLKDIAVLEFLAFFGGHFFQFVLLPSFLVGVACYNFERHKEQKKVNGGSEAEHKSRKDCPE